MKNNEREPRMFWLSSEAMVYTDNKPDADSLLKWDQVTVEKSYADALEAINNTLRNDRLELMEENKRLQSKLDEWVKDYPFNLHKLEAELAETKRKLEADRRYLSLIEADNHKLRAALEFYAEKKNWRRLDDQTALTGTPLNEFLKPEWAPIVEDCGKRARRALREQSESYEMSGEGE